MRRVKAAGLRIGILSNELELFQGRREMQALEILRSNQIRWSTPRTPAS